MLCQLKSCVNCCTAVRKIASTHHFTDQGQIQSERANLWFAPVFQLSAWSIYTYEKIVKIKVFRGFSPHKREAKTTENLDFTKFFKFGRLRTYPLSQPGHEAVNPWCNVLYQISPSSICIVAPAGENTTKNSNLNQI